MLRFFRYIVVIFCAMPVIAVAQLQKQVDAMQRLALLYKAKEQQDNEKLLAIAQQKGWDLVLRNKSNNTLARLTGIDSKGFPLYTTTNNNAIAAATTHTSYLWQNGLNLSGSSLNIKGKIAVWDEGAGNNNHIEIAGRIVNKDFSSNANHSTHIAGTLIANGTNPLVKGMAYGATQLLNYDYNNHISEMASQASNLLVSNHSYGNACGWGKLQSATYWTYYGLPGDTADYKFGIYNQDCQMFDSIAYNAPYYLIVKSVGNNRDKNGPLVGQDCYMYNDTGALILKPRPNGISSNAVYDNIPTYGVAKNILTIGAVEGIASGSTQTSDIKMSSFSSWGPTDDGRIKPDIVADGVDVLSCTSDGTATYESYSGTSMAAPNVTGSLFLLQELYSKKNNGNFMKAATLKALAIHTANESGNATGPDYKYGWGLLNAERAANMFAGKDTSFSKMIEATLNNNDTFKLNVIASGNGKLMATIVWADIAGEPTITNLLNNPTLKLVNDLDIRIVKNSITYYPWSLNPAMADAAAIKADNFRDDVEKIEIDNAIPGEAYTIQITHKGVLQRGS
ncbi:MAG: S8 family serine peptidase [Bacteroidetes bacterium]|nr:S8 family serine peptidase [Bacteroidota bacterium]